MNLHQNLQGVLIPPPLPRLSDSARRLVATPQTALLADYLLHRLEPRRALRHAA